MTATQIIGPRIAPLWADPVEWTSTRTYEPFTFVTYQGDSYCSRQDTPIGINITNDDYWVKVSDYNAQAVALQRTMTQTIETAETNMSDIIQTAKNDMTAQVNSVNTVKNELQKSLDALKTPNVILCGDSFTAGSLSDWITYIHGYNITNYAANGSSLHGKGSGNASFFDQLAHAHSDYPDSDDVYMLILYGGVNDHGDGQSYTAAGNNLASWINQATTYFPNTKIVVCYGNMGRSRYERFSTYYYWVTNVYNQIFETNNSKWVSLINPIAWLMGPSQGALNTADGYFKADNLHPTQKGDYVIATYMQGIMDGTYSYRNKTFFYTLQNQNFTSDDQSVTYNLSASQIRLIGEYNGGIYPTIKISMHINELDSNTPITENTVFGINCLETSGENLTTALSNYFIGTSENVLQIPCTSNNPLFPQLILTFTSESGYPRFITRATDTFVNNINNVVNRNYIWG